MDGKRAGGGPLDYALATTARPAVGRGLAYGVPEDEVDQWSAARKAATARGGANIADNEKVKRTIQ